MIKCSFLLFKVIIESRIVKIEKLITNNVFVTAYITLENIFRKSYNDFEGEQSMEQFKLFFEQVLPFVIVVVLVVLAGVLVYLFKMFKELNVTVNKVNTSVDLVNVALNDVNHKLADLNPTIETVKTISNTVDSGFKAGNKAVGSVVGVTKNTVSGLRGVVNNIAGKFRR